MIIKNIRIENFKSISSIKIDFSTDITVIVGKNGVGKTSILECIAYSLEYMQNHIYPENNDILSTKEINDSISNFIKKNELFTTIYTNISTNKKNSDISNNIQIILNSSNRKLQKASSISSNIENIRKYVDNLEQQPIFIYYKQDRGFNPLNNSKDTNIYSISLFEETKIINNLERWWDQIDAQEARRMRDEKEYDYRDPRLEAIRNLIDQLDSFDSIKYFSDKNPQGLYLEKKDGSYVHVLDLSSGERNYLILLADISRRLQILAPRKKLSDIQGIVLIDELELNLHPSWQSKIIPNLLKIFSSCQFIVTTHSPQILSTVNGKNIRIITNKNNFNKIEYPSSTRGRSSNYILEGIMESSERFPHVDNLIHKFNDSIDNNKLEEARNLLEDIKNELDGDIPDLLPLMNRLKRLEKK